MVGTSAGACWALKMVGPVARFKTRAEVITIRNGRLHNMRPPRVHWNWGLPGNVSCFGPRGKPNNHRGYRGSEAIRNRANRLYVTPLSAPVSPVVQVSSARL